MENASTALVIAGAVLISILIIGIGIAIYNNSGSGGKDQAEKAADKINSAATTAVNQLDVE